MADLDIARLRALLAKATPGERKIVNGAVWTLYPNGNLRACVVGVADDDEMKLIAAAVNALPEMLDAADAADPETLRFGPPDARRVRHAVAADGEHYAVKLVRHGSGMPSSAAFAVGGVDMGEFGSTPEAEEAAREHDRARRGGR